MKSVLLILVLHCIHYNVSAQARTDTVKPFCGVANGNERQPTDRSSRQPGSARLIDDGGVITIPVVFHVIWNTIDQNIPDTRIQEQLDRLNTDFRMLNTAEVANTPSVWSGLPTDAKFEFKLACVDPSGAITTGVTRHETFIPTSLTPDVPPSIIQWPPDTYLNIWICNSVSLGYGTYPWQYYGGLANEDGVTIDVEVVSGSTNANYTDGKILAHEVGHWLGLYHPHGTSCLWDDLVADTPPQMDNHFGTCPTFPASDPCTSPTTGSMFMNYMDYANDPCRYMFTAGQVDRMRSYIADQNTIDTRHPFLSNYFGFKGAVHDYIIQDCAEFDIPVSNPMCLPFTVSVTSGPVSIVSTTDQTVRVVVNEGASCSSFFELTISSTAYNYTDSRRFSYDKQICIIDPQITYHHTSPANVETANYVQDLQTCGYNALCYNSVGSEVFSFTGSSTEQNGNVWECRIVEDPLYPLTAGVNFWGSFNHGSQITPGVFYQVSTLQSGDFFYIGDVSHPYTIEIKLTNTNLQISSTISIKNVPSYGDPQTAFFCVQSTSVANYPHKIIYGTGLPGITYQWTFPSGMTLLTSSYILGVEWDDAGFNYTANPDPVATLQISNSYGCPPTIYSVHISPSYCFPVPRAIGNTDLVDRNIQFKNKKAERLTVYPNPAGNIIRIKSDKPVRQVRVQTINGYVAENVQQNAAKKEINIEKLAGGLYLLRIIYTDGSVETTKFFKQ